MIVSEPSLLICKKGTMSSQLKMLWQLTQYILYIGKPLHKQSLQAIYEQTRPMIDVHADQVVSKVVQDIDVLPPRRAKLVIEQNTKTEY